MKKRLITLAITVFCTVMSYAQRGTLKESGIRGAVIQITQTLYYAEEKFGKVETRGGNTTVWDYNDQGFITKVKSSLSDVIYSYQNGGRTIQITENGELSQTIECELNSFGRATFTKTTGSFGEFECAYSFKYDNNNNNNNLVEQIEYNEDGEEKSVTKFTLNAAGYPVKSTIYKVTHMGHLIDKGGAIWHYDKDNNFTGFELTEYVITPRDRNNSDITTLVKNTVLQSDRFGNWTKLLETSYRKEHGTDKYLHERHIVYADGTTTGYKPKQ